MRVQYFTDGFKLVSVKQYTAKLNYRKSSMKYNNKNNNYDDDNIIDKTRYNNINDGVLLTRSYIFHSPTSRHVIK